MSPPNPPDYYELTPKEIMEAYLNTDWCACCYYKDAEQHGCSHCTDETRFLKQNKQQWRQK